MIGTDCLGLFTSHHHWLVVRAAHTIEAKPVLEWWLPLSVRMSITLHSSFVLSHF